MCTYFYLTSFGKKLTYDYKKILINYNYISMFHIRACRLFLVVVIFTVHPWRYQCRWIFHRIFREVRPRIDYFCYLGSVLEIVRHCECPRSVNYRYRLAWSLLAQHWGLDFCNIIKHLNIKALLSNLVLIYPNLAKFVHNRTVFLITDISTDSSVRLSYSPGKIWHLWSKWFSHKIYKMVDRLSSSYLNK